MSLQAGSTYVFINAEAGNAVDLSGGNNKCVQDVIGYETHKGPNQQWTLEDAGDGFFRIKNGTGKYLSVDGDVRNGALVIGSNHQQTWKITVDDQHADSFRVFYPGTSFNLDLKDFGSRTLGTPVQLWNKTNGKNQAWLFQPT